MQFVVNVDGRSVIIQQDADGKFIIPAEFRPRGRFPSNFCWSHSPLCKRIGTKKVKGSQLDHVCSRKSDNGIYHPYGTQHRVGYTDADGMEEVESWDCAPDCPSWEFAKAGDRKVGHFNGHRNKPKTKNDYGTFGLQDEKPTRDESTGSAARFFQSCQFQEEDIPAFLYYAKASKRERDQGLDGMEQKPAPKLSGGEWVNLNGNGEGNKTIMRCNNHPCVKPLSLMKYLCRLITPPNGIILDPFAGSGTTLLAAKQEGFGYIGIEKEPEYCEIARKRISAIPTRLSQWEDK